jgi:hypothetical protein
VDRGGVPTGAGGGDARQLGVAALGAGKAAGGGGGDRGGRVSGAGSIYRRNESVGRPGAGGGRRAARNAINGVRPFACVVTRRAARVWPSRRRRARGGDASTGRQRDAAGETVAEPT